MALTLDGGLWSVSLPGTLGIDGLESNMDINQV